MFLAMYKISYTGEARDQISKLSHKNREHIKNAIERIAEEPERGKMLRHELKGLWSYRSGVYRIIYEVLRAEIVLIIVTVAHRKDVYLKIKRKYR
jgi:mRNA interferase RelE/StbE